MSVGFIIGMIFLAVFGGYVVTSLILMRFPTLIHDKKKVKFRCQHISHRGGAGENLENTMTAFKHARDVGTQMLEIDCHITRDGEVVVSHDNTLTRTTGQDIKITETDYVDLPQLKPALGLDFNPHHRTVGGEDRQIPLLRDLFHTFPHMPINIDLKIDNDQLIQAVNELIKQYNREDITVWGNRSDEVVRKLYALNPEIPVLCSMRRVLMIIGLFWTGLLPFVPLKESFYEVLMPRILLREDFQNNFLNKWRIVIRIFDFLMMSPVMHTHLARRGIQTYLWVLNDEPEFERAFKCKATGVMTDFPTKLKNWLDAHPQYASADPLLQQG